MKASAPCPARKPNRLQSVLELFPADTMKLQLAGFLLVSVNLAAASVHGDKILFRLTLAPLLVMLGANCFRDKYTGPQPKLAAEELDRPMTREEVRSRLEEITERRDVLSRYISRFNRFRLIWGGVYAVGESLVSVYALHPPLWAELGAVPVVLGLWLWAIRGMFQRENERKLKDRLSS
jgi:hypothetical protein